MNSHEFIVHPIEGAARVITVSEPTVEAVTEALSELGLVSGHIQVSARNVDCSRWYLQDRSPETVVAAGTVFYATPSKVNGER